MTDRLFGLASLALAGGYYFLARRLPASELSDATGPAGLPVIYAIVLAALAVLLLLRTGKVEASAATRLVDARGWRSAALTLAVGVEYVLAVPVIGYVAGVTALIAATAWAYGARLSLRTTAVAVSGAAVLWLLFVWLLGIPQPPGWWPDLVGQMLTGAARTS